MLASSAFFCIFAAEFANRQDPETIIKKHKRMKKTLMMMAMMMTTMMMTIVRSFLRMVMQS